MIDVWTETLLDITAAAKLAAFAHNGRAAHVSSLWRWIGRGALAKNGERVRLETIRTPGGVRTSREAIERFFEALNVDEPKAPSAWKASAAHAIATAQLSGAGM